MNVPLLDLGAQISRHRSELEAAMLRVLGSGRFVLGPEVAAFEAETAAYLGVNHSVGCASGTDALILALRALGVGPGDEVITSPFTFIATAEAVLHVGARPVFVDIEPDSFNLDPDAVERAIGPKTRALLPVHLFGQAADLDRLVPLAQARGLGLIEDAAQAIGAELNGKKLGGIGHIGTFSFYPTKNLGGAGDGGLVVTQDPKLAVELRLRREHGHVGGYRHTVVGYNSRLDELQAAILRVKLRALDADNQRRRDIADRYNAAFAGLSGLVTPTVRRGIPVWHQYTLRSPRRDAVRAKLAEAGVGSAVYYPLPLHQQPSMVHLSPGVLPETERAAAEVFSLPVHADLSDDQVARVIEVVCEAGAGTI